MRAYKGPTIASGHKEKHTSTLKISTYFDTEDFDKIKAEALAHRNSFAQEVRDLCAEALLRRYPTTELALRRRIADLCAALSLQSADYVNLQEKLCSLASPLPPSTQPSPKNSTSISDT